MDKSALIASFIEMQNLPDSFSETAEKYYVQLAEQIADSQVAKGQTYFVGINGCQGSGKSTMCQFIECYLQSVKGLTVATLSLDDFYYSKQRRQALSVKVHPLFVTRGVPGTHDVSLMAQVFSDLENQTDVITLPRFNKATDDPVDKSEWPECVCPADVVLMEGWCWGVTAQPEPSLISPVNELESENDSLAVWRKFVNSSIQEEYEPLYKKMDFWVMLRAPSFDCVFDWRLEQEQKLAAKTSESAVSEIMDESKLFHFIQHYQRLTNHGLATLPDNCDVVFELDTHRNFVLVTGLQ